ncbi:MAG: hypothetical protein JSV88_06395 [Candidatus Aminicenantes bacterium]|nr:MAG: hypothetical protein JSV88_06395 [Candidatus Aminicenantes bacterium]
MRRKKISFMIVGVLILISCLVSPMVSMADTPREYQKSFSKWMRMLPKEKRIQVEKVFESNLDCLENGDETSQPDLDKWRENVFRDLQPILSPGQLKEFTEIMNGKAGEQLSTTASKCWDCYSPLQNLDDAWAHLNSAQSLYRKSYCEYGFYPDQVLPLIIAAKTRTDLASQEANEAFNYCDCDSAEDALYQAQQAKWKVGYAIDNTKRYCSPYPWLNHLLSADAYLDTAISELSACINEACN